MIIYDPNQLLAPLQVQFLQQQVGIPFSLGGFKSLDDILSILNVPVKIEPGKPTRKAPAWLEEEKERYRLQKDKHASKEELEALNIKIDVIGATLNNYCSMSLLGEYVPSNNSIILYPEAMNAQENGLHMYEYLISTLAHEIMHAYFNRPGHEQFPYAMLVEEPLAEFGMLLFLCETKSSYYQWAYKNVEGKRTCYGQGVVLMEQYLSGLKSLKEYLEDYKIPIVGNSILDVSPQSKLLTLPKPQDYSVINEKLVFWNKVYQYPPKYHYDEQIRTLFLDGDISDINLRKMVIPPKANIERVCLGEHVVGNLPYHLNNMFKYVSFEVSVNNPEYFASNGVLLNKKTGKPILNRCSNDEELYLVFSNSKFGVIDSNLKQRVPCEYDRISKQDRNGLFVVKSKEWNTVLYGLVNSNGKEIVDAKCQSIAINDDGTYTIVKDGSEFTIDESGNKTYK